MRVALSSVVFSQATRAHLKYSDLNPMSALNELKKNNPDLLAVEGRRCLLFQSCVYLCDVSLLRYNSSGTGGTHANDQKGIIIKYEHRCQGKQKHIK